MEEIETSQQPQPNFGVEKVLLFIGERLAFILFAIFAGILLVSGVVIPKAFSEQEDPQFSRLDANWYQENISLPIKTVEQSSDTYEITAEVVTPTPTPTPQPIDTTNNDIWLKLADCESHQNWSVNSGNGYYGGLQFSQGAWTSVGGNGLPSDASSDEQIMRGKILQQKRGWGPWSACSKKIGLM